MWPCVLRPLELAAAKKAHIGSTPRVNLASIIARLIIAFILKRGPPELPATRVRGGMSRWRVPYSSISGFITEGSAPVQPALPQPLAPNGLVVAGTGWLALANIGASSARGIA